MRPTIPAPAAAASARVRRRRTAALALLVVAGCVNYMDRSAVAIANGPIRHDLGLSLTAMGVLLSAFAWAYGAAQIPAGLLVDRFGPRRVLALFLALWSGAQIWTAFARALVPFTIGRAALGIGEAPMYTGGTRVCADWYAEHERTVPVSVFNASASLGPAIAPALLTALMAAFGWRAMFVAIGVAGLAVALAWIALYRAPADLSLDPDERAAIGGSSEDPSAAAPPIGLRRLLRERTTWGMTIGFAGVIYTVWLYATWLPGYLQTARGLGAAAAGFLSAIPLAAGFVGALAGGIAADRLGRGTGENARHDPRTGCRTLVVAAMLGTALFTVAGALAPGTGAAIALLSGGVFFANAASSCGWALGALMAPPAAVGTLEAIQNVGGSLGGALAPLLTGVLVDRTGSFVPAFAGAAVLAVGAAGAYWRMVRDPIA